MRNKKKLIIISIIVSVFLFVGTGGIALADDEAEDTSRITFMETVAGILGITSEQLKDAFFEARNQMHELELEDRNAEQFKNILAEILNTEYSIGYAELENAIAQAKETMHEKLEARRAQLREQLETHKAELQQQLEARREQLRQLLEIHKSEQQEWLEARREQLMERLRVRKAELEEWFDSLNEDLSGRIDAWKTRLQEWREAQQQELQLRIEAWRGRVQEWRESQGIP